MPGFNQVSLARHAHALLVALQQVQARAPQGGRPVPPLLHEHVASIANALQRLHEQFALLINGDPLVATREDGGVRPDDVLHLVQWWRDGRLTKLLYKVFVYAVRDVATLCAKAPGGQASTPDSLRVSDAASRRTSQTALRIPQDNTPQRRDETETSEFERFQRAHVAFEQHLATPKAAQCSQSLVVLHGVLQLVIDAMQLLRCRPPASLHPPTPPPPPPFESSESAPSEAHTLRTCTGDGVDQHGDLNNNNNSTNNVSNSTNSEESRHGTMDGNASGNPQPDHGVTAQAAKPKLQQSNVKSSSRASSSQPSKGHLPAIKSSRASQSFAQQPSQLPPKGLPVPAPPPPPALRTELEQYQRLCTRYRRAQRLYLAWSGLQDAVLGLICNTPLLLNLTQLIHHAYPLLTLPIVGGSLQVSPRVATLWRQVWSVVPPAAALAHALSTAATSSLLPVATVAPPSAPVRQPVMDASSAAVVLSALADCGLLPQCCDVVLCVSRGALLQHSAARQTLTLAAQQLLAATLRLAAIAEVGQAFRSPLSTPTLQIPPRAAAETGTGAEGSGTTGMEEIGALSSAAGVESAAGLTTATDGEGGAQEPAIWAGARQTEQTAVSEEGTRVERINAGSAEGDVGPFALATSAESEGGQPEAGRGAADQPSEVVDAWENTGKHPAAEEAEKQGAGTAGVRTEASSSSVGAYLEKPPSHASILPRNSQSSQQQGVTTGQQSSQRPTSEGANGPGLSAAASEAATGVGSSEETHQTADGGGPLIMADIATAAMAPEPTIQNPPLSLSGIDEMPSAQDTPTVLEVFSAPQINLSGPHAVPTSGRADPDAANPYGPSLADVHAGSAPSLSEPFPMQASSLSSPRPPAKASTQIPMVGIVRPMPTAASATATAPATARGNNSATSPVATGSGGVAQERLAAVKPQSIPLLLEVWAEGLRSCPGPGPATGSVGGAGEGEGVGVPGQVSDQLAAGWDSPKGSTSLPFTASGAALDSDAAGCPAGQAAETMLTAAPNDVLAPPPPPPPPPAEQQASWCVPLVSEMSESAISSTSQILSQLPPSNSALTALPTGAKAAWAMLTSPAVQYFLCERQASAVVQAYRELAATRPQARGSGRNAATIAASVSASLATTWIVEPMLGATPPLAAADAYAQRAARAVPQNPTGGVSLADVLDTARSTGLDLLPLPVLPWSVPVDAALAAQADLFMTLPPAALASPTAIGVEASIGPAGLGRSDSMGTLLPPGSASWVAPSASAAATPSTAVGHSARRRKEPLTNVVGAAAAGSQSYIGGGGGGKGMVLGGDPNTAPKLPPLRMPICQPDADYRKREAQKVQRVADAMEHEAQLLQLLQATAGIWHGLISGAATAGGKKIDGGGDGGDEAGGGSTARPGTPIGLVPSASRVMLQLISIATVCRAANNSTEALAAAMVTRCGDGAATVTAPASGRRTSPPRLRSLGGGTRSGGSGGGDTFEEIMAALLATLVGNLGAAHRLCQQNERTALHEQLAGLLVAALSASQALLERTGNPDVSTPLVAITETCLDWIMEAHRQRLVEQQLAEDEVEAAETAAADAEAAQLERQLTAPGEDCSEEELAAWQAEVETDVELAHAAAVAVARAAAARLAAAARDAVRLGAAVTLCEASVRFLVAHHRGIIDTLQNAGLLRPGLRLRKEHSRHTELLQQMLSMLVTAAGYCAVAVAEAHAPRALHAAAATAAPPNESPLALAAASHSMTSSAVAATYAPVMRSLLSALFSVRKCLRVCLGQLGVESNAALLTVEAVPSVCAALCAFPGHLVATLLPAHELAAAMQQSSGTAEEDEVATAQEATTAAEPSHAASSIDSTGGIASIGSVGHELSFAPSGVKGNTRSTEVSETLSNITFNPSGLTLSPPQPQQEPTTESISVVNHNLHDASAAAAVGTAFERTGVTQSQTQQHQQQEGHQGQQQYHQPHGGDQADGGASKASTPVPDLNPAASRERARRVAAAVPYLSRAVASCALHITVPNAWRIFITMFAQLAQLEIAAEEEHQRQEKELARRRRKRAEKERFPAQKDGEEEITPTETSSEVFTMTSSERGILKTAAVPIPPFLSWEVEHARRLDFSPGARVGAVGHQAGATEPTEVPVADVVPNGKVTSRMTVEGTSHAGALTALSPVGEPAPAFRLWFPSDTTQESITTATTTISAVAGTATATAAAAARLASSPTSLTADQLTGLSTATKGLWELLHVLLAAHRCGGAAWPADAFPLLPDKEEELRRLLEWLRTPRKRMQSEQDPGAGAPASSAQVAVDEQGQVDEELRTEASMSAAAPGFVGSAEEGVCEPQEEEGAVGQSATGAEGQITDWREQEGDPATSVFMLTEIAMLEAGETSLMTPADGLAAPESNTSSEGAEQGEMEEAAPEGPEKVNVTRPIQDSTQPTLDGDGGTASVLSSGGDASIIVVDDRASGMGSLHQVPETQLPLKNEKSPLYGADLAEEPSGSGLQQFPAELAASAKSGEIGVGAEALQQETQTAASAPSLREEGSAVANSGIGTTGFKSNSADVKEGTAPIEGATDNEPVDTSLSGSVTEWREAVALLGQLLDLTEAWRGLRSTESPRPPSPQLSRAFLGFDMPMAGLSISSEEPASDGPTEPEPPPAEVLAAFLHGHDVGIVGGGSGKSRNAVSGGKGGSHSVVAMPAVQPAVSTVAAATNACSFQTWTVKATPGVLLPVAEATRVMASFQLQTQHLSTAAASVTLCGCSYAGCTNLSGGSEVAMGSALVCRCERVSYCSAACQGLDWIGGHQAACKVRKRTGLGQGATGGMRGAAVAGSASAFASASAGASSPAAAAGLQNSEGSSGRRYFLNRRR